MCRCKTTISSQFLLWPAHLVLGDGSIHRRTNLLFRVAPYGRYQNQSKGWGPEISATVGWIVMEAPASVAPLALFSVVLDETPSLYVRLCPDLAFTHFPSRLLFPFRRRGGGQMPLVIALLAVVFNPSNAYLNWRVFSRSLACATT